MYKTEKWVDFKRMIFTHNGQRFNCVLVRAKTCILLSFYYLFVINNVDYVL